MTRDYKYSSTHHRRRSLPGWIWLLTGLSIGLAVAFIVYLNGQKALKESRQNAADIPVETIAKQTKTQPVQQSTTPANQRFDFYTLLPELEVVVPQETQQHKQTIPRQKPLPSESSPDPPRNNPKISGGYLLQAGSFQKLQEADSLKAKLALIGIESNIESVHVNTETWHRVRIGPYQNRSQLNQVRARLRKNNVETLLLIAKE